MPTSARVSQGFFGQFADVGIRAPEQTDFCNTLWLAPLIAERFMRLAGFAHITAVHFGNALLD